MHVVVASNHRLPVAGYGGSQRVAVALVRALAALGHRVTLAAQPGTRVPEAAQIVDVPPKVLKDPGADLTPFLPAGAEILHAHFPIKRGPAGLPFVQTLHGNWKPGAPLPPNTIFLSRDHARRHGSDTFVYNGLDPAEFVFRRRKESWDLFLGKLHSAKGYHWAVEAAKRTGRRLIVAGGWRPSFTGAIKYVGEVDGNRKAVLLARARCLWMPALWDEPFGLPTIEALLSGTPVLGTRRGALPEIVTPDVGGLCDTLEEILAAAETIGTRSPDACRAHAERYFTHRVMAEEYARMYRAVMETGKLPAGRPTPYTTS
jgi:glycosyltransferase involved in cell wall biosynthesis